MSTGNSEKIGVTTATIVGMNAMIGAGIFAIPTSLALGAGPAGIITFALMAVSVWFMAQSIARVAQLYPQEGSFYTYAKQWGGHYVGLLASSFYLIGLLIAMGLLTHAAGDHLVRYLPEFSVYTLGLCTLIGLTVLNILGASLSSLGQQILIICTVFPLIVTAVMCFLKADFANLFPFIPYGSLSILKATRVVAFSFFGFEAAASLFNIIKNPEENLPKALTYSLIIVSGLYLIFVTSLVLAVPLDLFKQYPGPIAGPLSIIFPHSKWVIEAVHISSISAILGTLHSMIWSSGYLFLTLMKKFRNKPTQLLLAHGIMNHRTATLCMGLAIFISFKTLTNEMFFDFTALFLILAFSLSMITLLTLKEEWKSKQNYITLAGLATAAMIFYFAVADIITSV
ncbi:APC family permease [Candidatus Babeliales bacterium]|nr:APC family permease [Candidatus Babeliales bacterium]